jgi:hypothetical protein
MAKPTKRPKKPARVHCCACLNGGFPSSDSTCAKCGSEDVFTAVDLIQGEIDDAPGNRHRVAAMCFLLEELKAGMK